MALRPLGTADRLYWAASVVVLLWALFLNFFRLRTPNVLADEPTYAAAGWSYVHGRVPTQVNARGNFQHPPLAKLLYGLAQLAVGHESVTADRMVAATATILTGAVVAIWIARATDRWAGLLAGAFVVLLPEAIPDGTTLRFGRYGFLDPIAELFAVVYLYLLWQWFTGTRRRAWVFAAAAGVAIGCATASKENGFLAALVPVLLYILAAWRQWRLLARRVGLAVLAAMTGLVAFLVTYAPFTHPLQRIQYDIAFQTRHSDNGHLVGLAGRVTWHPPWWANLWFAAHGMGIAVTAFVVGFAILACVLRRDRLVVFLLAALTGPFIFHCFIAGVALPFYWTLWMPPLFALTALGVAEVIRRVWAASLPSPIQVGAALLALLVPLLACLSLTRLTAAITRYGPEVLRPLLVRHRLTGPVLASGLYRFEFGYYTPGLRVFMRPPASLARIDAVVIGAPQCRLEPDNRTTRAIVATNVAAGRLRQIYADQAMTVYAVTSRLTMPSPAEIEAQPPTNLAAGC